MKRKGTFDKSLIFLSLIIAVIAATAVFIYIQVRTDAISEDIQAGRPIHILFLATRGEDLLFSEVFLYNPVTEKGSIFDVPGNVGSIIKNLGRIDRIDVLFDRENTDDYRKKVEELLDTPIPYTITIDMPDLVKLVDIMEGLDMFIANPTEILDQEPPILLPSGSLVLDGSKVETYLTYEALDENENEKTGRYQRFMLSFLKKIGEKSSLLVDQKTFPYVKTFIRTDLSRQALVSLIVDLSSLDADRTVLQRVHGTVRAVDSVDLLFPHLDGKLLKETARQTVESLANTDIVSSDELTISIEVLNGSGVSGMAGRTSQIFESFGFDVVRIANADRSDYENTLVIARMGDLSTARKVANVIQCDRVSAMQQDFSVAGTAGLGEVIDVTVLIGKDFDGRYVKK